MILYEKTVRRIATEQGINFDQSYNPRDLYILFRASAQRVVSEEDVAPLSYLASSLIRLGIIKGYKAYTWGHSHPNLMKSIHNSLKNSNIKIVRLEDAVRMAYGEEEKYELRISNLNVHSDREYQSLRLISSSELLYEDEEKLKQKIKTMTQVIPVIEFSLTFLPA